MFGRKSSPLHQLIIISIPNQANETNKNALFELIQQLLPPSSARFAMPLLVSDYGFK